LWQKNVLCSISLNLFARFGQMELQTHGKFLILSRFLILGTLWNQQNMEISTVFGYLLMLAHSGSMFAFLLSANIKWRFFVH
jgi:hypothetical protein